MRDFTTPKNVLSPSSIKKQLVISICEKSQLKAQPNTEPDAWHFFFFFFYVQFPLMPPISLKGRCRQLGDGNRYSPEGLALIQGFAHGLGGPLPPVSGSSRRQDPVSAMSLTLVRLPIWTQWKGKRLGLEDSGQKWSCCCWFQRG